jgi:hypothetical protein
MLIQFTQRERLRSRRNAVAFILVAMLGSPLGVYAVGDDTSPSIFSFSAVGTFGVVHSSEDRADFTASPLAPDGAGFSDSFPLSPQIAKFVQLLT